MQSELIQFDRVSPDGMRRVLRLLREESKKWHHNDDQKDEIRSAIEFIIRPALAAVGRFERAGLSRYEYKPSPATKRAAKLAEERRAAERAEAEDDSRS